MKYASGSLLTVSVVVELAITGTLSPSPPITTVIMAVEAAVVIIEVKVRGAGEAVVTKAHLATAAVDSGSKPTSSTRATPTRTTSSPRPT